MAHREDSSSRRRPRTGSFPTLCATPNSTGPPPVEEEPDPPSREALHCDWLTAIGFADRTARSSARREPLRIHIGIEGSPFDVRSAGLIVSARCALSETDAETLSVYVNGRPIDSWTTSSKHGVVARFLLDEARFENTLQVNSANTLTVLGRTVNGRPFWGECGFSVIES